MTTDHDFSHLRPKDKEILKYRQAAAYQNLLDDYLTWIAEEGKNPDKNEGYSTGTVTRRLATIRQIMYWSWADGDVNLTITEDEADAFVNALADDDYRQNNGEKYRSDSKRKYNDTLRSWFRWKNGGCKELVWEPKIKFEDRSPANSADMFEKNERQEVYDAALVYNTTPEYGNLSPTERDRRKAAIAERIGKPKEEVSPKDFEKINRSWKIPSLVSLTLDIGLRPCEINRSSIEWLHLDKREIQIPSEDAAKNREQWRVPFQERTGRALESWLEQREEREKYDGRDEIWLNRKSNPYTSANLNYLLQNLLEETDIDCEARNIVWYSFRHSTGQYIYDSSDKMTTAAVLRHVDEQSVERYAGPPPEKIRQAQRDAS